MSISAQIIADSINPKGCRLTTYVLEYHRYVHAELLTHRCFSKNAASSRAIPIEKMIEAVQTNPAMPVWWGKNQSGMQAKEELTNDQLVDFSHFYGADLYHVGSLEAGKRLWLKARDSAIQYVRHLNDIGLHKQIANRILEPWFHIRIILSGTDFENFFALRAHGDAQPEIQELAYKMLEAYNASTPRELKVGEWHIPFGDKMDDARLNDLYNELYDGGEMLTLPQVSERFDLMRRKIAIARCARISYLNFEGKDDYAADIKLCDRLFGANPKHLSPTEHVAQCLDSEEYVGNFRGWKQMRKMFADESLCDPRVKK
jgi:thymidylate synthase ThyX